VLVLPDRFHSVLHLLLVCEQPPLQLTDVSFVPLDLAVVVLTDILIPCLKAVLLLQLVFPILE
jgi:hypothetical protein